VSCKCCTRCLSTVGEQGSPQDMQSAIPPTPAPLPRPPAHPTPPCSFWASLVANAGASLNKKQISWSTLNWCGRRSWGERTRPSNQAKLIFSSHFLWLSPPFGVNLMPGHKIWKAEKFPRSGKDCSYEHENAVINVGCLHPMLPFQDALLFFTAIRAGQ